MDKNIRVARLSIMSNTVLTTGKLAIGAGMGSISVISEGLHSGIDLLAAIIAYFSIHKASKPADTSYQFGYGKYENVASIIEALLIVAAAIVIVIGAWPRLFNPEPVLSLHLGIAVMSVSAIVNAVVSHILLKTARETESPALAADGWHLRTDVYTSVGVLLGIGMIKLTGWYIVDPIIALAVSLLILKAAWDLIRDSMKSILDVSLPEEEKEIIKNVLKKYEHKYVDFHALRTRKAGAERHIDLHLVTAHHLSVGQVHRLCKEIENSIRNEFPRCEVLIHAEPCDGSCQTCIKEKEKDKDQDPAKCAYEDPGEK